MTSDPQSQLFDFAGSKRTPETEDEHMVTDIHAALGFDSVPLRLRKPPAAPPARSWRHYFPVAAAVVLVIALLGASFSTLVPDSDNSDQFASVPPVVLGLASPDSAGEATTCAFGESIPVVTGTDSSPIDGTVLLLTADGDLILDCAGKQISLATGIQAVTPQSWPGVVSTWDGENLTYLNIVTGKSYVSEDLDQLNSQRSLAAITSRSTNQLIIVPATGSPSDAAVLDLATLEEQKLVDHNDNAIPFTSIPAATSNYQGDCMVIAYSIHNTRQNTSYLGGFVVVRADGRMQTVNSASLQSPPPREIATSPDCDQIASVTFQGEQMSGTTRLMVQAVTGGQSLSVSMETSDVLTHITWLKSGSGIVYARGEDLMLWETPFESTEPISLHEGLSIDSISLTLDPTIVSASAMDWSATDNPSRTLIVNSATQHVTELNGYDLYPGRSLQPRERNVLLMQTEPVQVYNAVTGEHLGDLQADAASPSDITIAGPDQLSSAEIGLVGTGTSDLWRVLDSEGQPIFESIEPPTDLDYGKRLAASISGDGWIYLSPGADSSAGWMKQLDNPNATWVEVVFDPNAEITGIQFLNTEGLTFNDLASTATCDTTADIPIFTGINESPIPAMSVLLTPDGILQTSCQGEVTVLDEDVSHVSATFTPHVFFATTAEGRTFYNLKTGESLSVPSDDPMNEMEIIPSAWGSWIIMASSDDSSMASIYDLDSFTETPIIGPEEKRLELDQMYNHAIAANDSAVAIAFGSTPFSSDPDIIPQPLQGFFIATKNGESQFVNAEADVAPRSIALSPDGEIIAASTYEGTVSTGTTTISLYHTTDGSLISSSENETINIQSGAHFLMDGSALLFTDGAALYKIDLSTDQLQPEVLVEGQAVFGLIFTPDPNVVAIGYRPTIDSGTSKQQTAIINIATGDIQILDGLDMFTYGGGTAYVRSTLVLSQSGVYPGGSASTIVVNAATGEKLGETKTIVRPQDGFTFSASGYGRGEIVVFAFDPDSIWRVVDETGQPTFEKIEPPAAAQDLEIPDMHVTVSPDGFMQLRTFEPNRIWLKSPDSAPGEWIELESLDDPEAIPVSIEFILGDD